MPLIFQKNHIVLHAQLSTTYYYIHRDYDNQAEHFTCPGLYYSKISPTLIISDFTFAASIDILHDLYHQRLSEDTFVAKNQVFDLIHDIFHQRTDIF